MKPSIFLLAWAICCSGAISCIPAEKDFVFSPYTVISVQDELQKEEAEWFAWLFARPAGFVLQVKLDADDPDIYVCTDSTMKEGAYSIKVEKGKIHIRASSQTGFFGAFQTLQHSLPQEIGSNRYVRDVRWAVPVMEVYESRETELWPATNFRIIANIIKNP